MTGIVSEKRPIQDVNRGGVGWPRTAKQKRSFLNTQVTLCSTDQRVGKMHPTAKIDRTEGRYSRLKGKIVNKSAVA